MNLVDYTLEKNGRNYWYTKIDNTGNTNFVFLGLYYADCEKKW